LGGVRGQLLLGLSPVPRGDGIVGVPEPDSFGFCPLFEILELDPPADGEMTVEHAEDPGLAFLDYFLVHVDQKLTVHFVDRRQGSAVGVGSIGFQGPQDFVSVFRLES
jgi:hypothetical protein